MIAIIIPIYNQEKFLNETLQSVLLQTVSNWECILVNDGSTDQSETICLEFVAKDNRFSYLKKENGGLASARNYGIQNANAEYIFPLDADDKIAENCLAEIYKVIQTNPQVDVVTFDVQFFDFKQGTYTLPTYNYKKLLIQNCFVACTPFKRSIWEQNKGYDENLKSFEDWDFWIRGLNENAVVVKIPKTLFYYRKHEKESLTNRFKTEPHYYYSLYDYIYTKNKLIYDKYYGNPILAFHDNELLKGFSAKVKNNLIFKLYEKIKKF